MHPVSSAFRTMRQCLTSVIKMSYYLDPACMTTRELHAELWYCVWRRVLALRSHAMQERLREERSRFESKALGRRESKQCWFFYIAFAQLLSFGSILCSFSEATAMPPSVPPCKLPCPNKHTVFCVFNMALSQLRRSWRRRCVGAAHLHHTATCQLSAAAPFKALRCCKRIQRQ